MFLKGNFLGVTPLFGTISIIPPVVLYDNHKFYGGNTGATFSKIWGRNIALTEGDVSSNYTPYWSNDTYLLANFNNNLDAGNIENLSGSVEGWSLYRKADAIEALEFLASFTTENINYYDFSVINNQYYKYYLFAKSGTSLSSAITSNEITSDYYGWFLIDLENRRAYHFDINFDGGNKTYIENHTEHKTNNKTNSFTRGRQFFIEGSVSAIISKDNLRKDLQYTNADLLSLSEFISSERPKLLKSRRGEIFNVFTYGYSESLLNPALGENIYTSNFSFREVGDL